MGENTKQMQGIGMAGIDLQNLWIKPDRFVQAPAWWCQRASASTS